MKLVLLLLLAGCTSQVPYVMQHYNANEFSSYERKELDKMIAHSIDNMSKIDRLIERAQRAHSMADALRRENNDSH